MSAGIRWKNNKPKNVSNDGKDDIDNETSDSNRLPEEWLLVWWEEHFSREG